MQIFAYSGPQENSFDGPKAVQNSASIFFDRDTARPCIRADLISNKAGITVIKLTISKNGVILAQHDFMVGWMAIASARMTNAGSVTENAGVEPGNSVNVQVTGSIPLNSEFQADLGLPPQLTMPNDWARWAGAMATTDQNLGGVNALPASSYWDIHDSSGPGGDGGNPDIHVAGFCSPTTPSTTIDQVDNCNGPGMGSGKSFSRVFGDSGTGVGPFDPSYSDTLLSDGNLNSFDAPMPALKIVFNSSGGMGGFVDSDLDDKSRVYNRTCARATGCAGCLALTVSRTDAHNLYAPYYTHEHPGDLAGSVGRRVRDGRAGLLRLHRPAQQLPGLRVVRPVSLLADRADPRPEREPGHELPAHDVRTTSRSTGRRTGSRPASSSSPTSTARPGPSGSRGSTTTTSAPRSASWTTTAAVTSRA